MKKEGNPKRHIPECWNIEMLLCKLAEANKKLLKFQFDIKMIIVKSNKKGD